MRNCWALHGVNGPCQLRGDADPVEGESDRDWFRDRARADCVQSRRRISLPVIERGLLIARYTATVTEQEAALAEAQAVTAVTAN